MLDICPTLLAAWLAQPVDTPDRYRMAEAPRQSRREASDSVARECETSFCASVAQRMPG